MVEAMDGGGFLVDTVILFTGTYWDEELRNRFVVRPRPGDKSYAIESNR